MCPFFKEKSVSKAHPNHVEKRFQKQSEFQNAYKKAPALGQRLLLKEY
jgi:hypothetical protein